MRARGFEDTWCSWISNVLKSGRTAILLNGVPGRWLHCRRGLRQGDPISPYLFIIVADVLQRLIRRASFDGLVSHPIDLSLPCPVLQYADDTLILIKGDLACIRSLKQILDSFSRATGFYINIQKSTFIPMHIATAEAEIMAEVLGCSISASFPQPYLGLPLSPHKLRVSGYQPLISSFDRYLVGWKSKLLSSGGRVVLVNAVLSSLPIHYMLALLIPKTVRDQIDARRRAFLWSGGGEKTSRTQCLIAWERVCLSKDAGGLGIRNLEDQMTSLMKLVSKLHGLDDLPWKQWFRRHTTGDLGTGALATHR